MLTKYCALWYKSMNIGSVVNNFKLNLYLEKAKMVPLLNIFSMNFSATLPIFMLLHRSAEFSQKYAISASTKIRNNTMILIELHGVNKKY